MGTRLFVGNLSYETTEETLRTHLSTVGPVKNISIMRDRETGQSRGFAFVEMETDQGAQQAIQQLNNVDFEGRQILVKEARPREERTPFERPSRPAGPGGFERRPPAPRGPSRPPMEGGASSEYARPMDNHGPAVPGPQEDVQPRKPKRREHPKGGTMGSSGGGSGIDWDRPRRGRVKSENPPPMKSRMRAWDLDEDADEDLDDVDPWAGFDFLQEEEEENEQE